MSSLTSLCAHRRVPAVPGVAAGEPGRAARAGARAAGRAAGALRGRRRRAQLRARRRAAGRIQAHGERDLYTASKYVILHIG